MTEPTTAAETIRDLREVTITSGELAALLDRLAAAEARAERAASIALPLLEARHNAAHRGGIYDGGTWEDGNCGLCGESRDFLDALAAAAAPTGEVRE